MMKSDLTVSQLYIAICM